MSRRGFRGEDVLLKKVLSHELLQVLSESPTLDGRVSVAFVVGALLLKPGERRVVLERSRVSDSWLIFECDKNFVDEEFQWNEVFHRYVVSQ